MRRISHGPTPAAVLFALLAAMALVVLIGFLIAFWIAALAQPLQARDLDGRFKHSPLKPWFDSLKNKQDVGCCDTSDGRRLEDAEWGTNTNGEYWVVIDGVRYQVPEHALLTQKNRAGVAIVWPYLDPATLQMQIRCFIPGALI